MAYKLKFKIHWRDQVDENQIEQDTPAVLWFRQTSKPVKLPARGVINNIEQSSDATN